MSVQYPSHLYIRVDRPLRDGLNKAAEREGMNVSELARQVLRSALDKMPEPCRTGGEAPAASRS